MAEYIEREALKAAVRKRLNSSLIIGWLISIINDCPAADVVERSSFEAVGQKYAQIQNKLIRGELVPVVHGRWLEADDGDGIVCSVCGTDFCTLLNETEKFNGCPHCLARMDGE